MKPSWRRSTEQQIGAAVAILPYRERSEERPDPTEHLAALAVIIAAIAWPVAHFYGEARRGPILLGKMRALLALLTIIPALWATHVWRSPETLGFTGLAVAGTLSGMVWLLGIVALRHPACGDLTGMALHILEPLRRRFSAENSHS